MAKNMVSKTTNIKVVGTLDKNENGEYIVAVETKEELQVYNLEDFLSEMIGTEISLCSVDELI